MALYREPQRASCPTGQRGLHLEGASCQGLTQRWSIKGHFDYKEEERGGLRSWILKWVRSNQGKLPQNAGPPSHTLRQLVPCSEPTCSRLHWGRDPDPVGLHFVLRVPVSINRSPRTNCDASIHTRRKKKKRNLSLYFRQRVCGAFSRKGMP